MRYLIILFLILFSFKSNSEIFCLNEYWIIYIHPVMDEIIDEIDKKSNGEFLPLYNKWVTTMSTDKPDWVARRNAYVYRDLYYKGVKENIESSFFFECGNYLESANLQPEEVTTIPVGIDSHPLGVPEFVYYSYIKLPFRMRYGKRYFVNNEKYVFDHSYAIKVNQEGYLKDGPKIAYMGGCLYNSGMLDLDAYKSFSIINSSGNTFYSGFISEGIEDPSSGEKVYKIDFTEVDDEIKDAIIYIPGVGKSFPFSISNNVYNHVFKVSMEGFYRQRCGIKLDVPWPRIKCHNGPQYKNDFIAITSRDLLPPQGYDRFNIIGYTQDLNTVIEPFESGGWHDAADWDKNNRHYIPIFDMLYIYEMYPKKFSDGQLGMKNGIPDILDEVEYGLRPWKKSINNEGGVSGFLETTTHPSISDSRFKYSYSKPTRWDSLLFAAASAMLSEKMEIFSKEESEELKNLAIKAYNFGLDPKNSLGQIEIKAATNRGAGNPYVYNWEETENMILPYLAHASFRLYKLTGDETYLNNIKYTAKPYTYPFNFQDYSPWFYLGIVKELKPTLIQEFYIKPADKLLSYLNQPYEKTWEYNRTYWMSWGATVMTNYNRCLIAAYFLTNDNKYKESIIRNFDFMLGANPMGMSWTTGLGDVYPVVIQHETSQTDGVLDPVPGITIYGITEGMYPDLTKYVYTNPISIPQWRRWSAHPTNNISQCEFTIQETMSSTMLSAAFLQDGGVDDTKINPKNVSKYYLP